MGISRNRPPSLSGSARQIRPRSPAEALEPTRAPSRPSGSRARGGDRPANGFVRLVSGVFTAALMAMVLFGGSVLLVNHLYDSAGPLQDSQAVTIRSGEGRLEIAGKLESAGVIQNRQLFVMNYFGRNFVRWFSGEKWRDLKAGEYEFKAGSSMRAVLDAIAKGRTVFYQITVPEGLTSQQIVKRVMSAPDLVGEIAQVPPEGSLLPDSYRFSKGSTREDLLKRMTKGQKQLAVELWEKRVSGLPIATIDEAVILASIVEKETGQRSERKHVAAVFVNRLRMGMRLQSDPTIIYGIAGGKGPLGRPLYKSDIKKKTPYNTYQIKGLPPGAICNPGRAALEAVLSPDQSDDLFFVADGSGGHQFSKTLKEHNAAVANWRKIEKQARVKAKADAAARKIAEAASANETAGQVATAGGTLAATSGSDAVPVGGNGAVVTVTNAQVIGTGAVAAAGAAKSEPAGEPAAVASTDGIPLPVRKPR